MSAALQLPVLWGETDTEDEWTEFDSPAEITEDPQQLEEDTAQPVASLAFYRRHTENLLRRYLYASMQVGRTPSILGEPVTRGWASSRRVRTFEDAVIFVLDVEKCLDRLNSEDRQILCKVIVQAYTQTEAAMQLGMSTRTMAARFPEAVDCLTEELLDAGLLTLQ